ncbi:MAG: FHA domain-containing protein [Nostocoides sp.]
MHLPNVGDGTRVESGVEAEHVLTRADQAMVDALRPGTALLVVLRGPNTGARFLLDDDQVIAGRHPDSDIFLDDVTVSRKHATFRREGGAFHVHDVGSLNGTYVNRQIVDDVRLQTGDEVQIGKFRLVFYSGRS